MQERERERETEVLLSSAFWKGAEIGTLSKQRCVFEWEHSGSSGLGWSEGQKWLKVEVFSVRRNSSLSFSHTHTHSLVKESGTIGNLFLLTSGNQVFKDFFTSI